MPQTVSSWSQRPIRWIGENMRERYLEVTFRKGRALAAYLYLPRPSDAKSTRTEQVAEGILVDYMASGDPIGIEITAPTQVTVESLNAILDQLGQPPISEDEFAPLAA